MITQLDGNKELVELWNREIRNIEIDKNDEIRLFLIALEFYRKGLRDMLPPQFIEEPSANPNTLSL